MLVIAFKHETKYDFSCLNLLEKISVLDFGKAEYEYGIDL